MSKTFSFLVPAPDIGQSEPVQARMYYSDTLTGARSLLSSSILADLGYTSAPPETLTWAIAAADGTKYYWLGLVSSTGVEGQLAYLAPEVTIGQVTIEVWTESAIGTAVQGVKFSATPIRNGAGAAGAKTIIVSGQDLTDANGYAYLTLYADSGEYVVTLKGYSSITFDTTGKSGQTINYASEL